MNLSLELEPEPVSLVSTWVYRTTVQLRKLRERSSDVHPPLNLRDLERALDKSLEDLEEFAGSGEDAEVDVAAPSPLPLPALMDVCTYADALHLAAERLDVLLVQGEVPRWMLGVFKRVRSSLLQGGRELVPAALIVTAQRNVLVPSDPDHVRLSPLQLAMMADRAYQKEPGRKMPYHALTSSAAPYQPVASVRVVDQPCSEPHCRAPIGQLCHADKPLWRQHPHRMLLTVRTLVGLGNHGWQPPERDDE